MVTGKVAAASCSIFNFCLSAVQTKQPNTGRRIFIRCSFLAAAITRRLKNLDFRNKKQNFKLTHKKQMKWTKKRIQNQICALQKHQNLLYHLLIKTDGIRCSESRRCLRNQHVSTYYKHLTLNLTSIVFQENN